MKRIGLVVVAVAAVVLVTSCDKLGVGGAINRAVGNWASITLPAGCVAKQIAAEEHGGVAVLCEDGRIFH